MLQTKELFSNPSFGEDNLEKVLNKFLEENKSLKIIDIKYNRVCSETRQYSSVLVIYEVNEQNNS